MEQEYYKENDNLYKNKLSKKNKSKYTDKARLLGLPGSGYLCIKDY